MVAYSFQKRFAEPILERRKTHTIRANRKRHARPGEELQLYVGMRTRQCRLLMRATCIDIFPITIKFNDDPKYEGVLPYRALRFDGGLDAFAIADGFTGWADLKAFWQKHHPGVEEFTGVMIRWEPQPTEGENG